MRGFARIAAAVPAVRVGDVDHNQAATLALWRRADADGCALVVFPELGLPGYTARDLFLDRHLQERCLAALAALVEASRGLTPMAAVGLPLRVGPSLFNVAAVISRGRLLGLVPKAYLPNYREFEEVRWFAPGAAVPAGSTARVSGQDVPFGTDLLFAADGDPDLVIGFEICEDYWVQQPPSGWMAGAGATVLCNLSASNFTLGKSELRRLLAQSASERQIGAYLYCAAGPGESSTDLAFDADAFVFQQGEELAASQRFAREPQLVVADVDVESIVRARLATNSFGDCARAHRRPFRRLGFAATPHPGAELRRPVHPHPFIPRDPATLARRCWEVFEIQVNALVTRLAAIGGGIKLVLGVSGGLDSTQAALVCANALDQLGRPRTDLVCVTMPGLGTTERTRSNAELLAEQLGASFRTIGVSDPTLLVLQASGHRATDPADDVAALVARLQGAPELADVTLENVQARLRTLLLMTLANQLGGLVVGTGDLSEKALGWATYAGDHIAMYDVNAGVPKTLIQFVIRWVANERVQTWTEGEGGALRETLFSILDTPISPELVPPDAEGRISQLTESAIGPYELHDFFLWHFVKHGARPGRILDLARIAFDGRYPDERLAHWLRTFLRRFFHNQFKRSCTADAPKVTPVALSPRGDWRMPSDASVSSWLAEVDRWLP